MTECGTKVHQFEWFECVDCFCSFGVPLGYTKMRRDDCRTFYCPNGHPMSFKEGAADRYRREAERLKQQMAQKDDEIRRERQRLELEKRSSAAYRGQVTRLKNRARAGVCPCCTRHFENLERHMKTKHPHFDPEMVEDVA